MVLFLRFKMVMWQPLGLMLLCGSLVMCRHPTAPIVNNGSDQEEQEEPAWGGRIAEAYAREPRQSDTIADQLNDYLLLDDVAKLLRAALIKLQQALIVQNIPEHFREEAQREYVQVVFNQVRVLCEMELCAEANRWLDWSFTSPAVVPPRVATSVRDMREEISTCRTRQAETVPAWDPGEYRRVLDDARRLYTEAQETRDRETALSRQRFFEAQVLQRLAITMLIDALRNDRIEADEEVDAAEEELFELFQLTLASVRSLDLCLPDIALVELIQLNADLCPDSVQCMPPMEHCLDHDCTPEACRLDGSVSPTWSYAEYEQLIRQADRAYAETRARTP